MSLTIRITHRIYLLVHSDSIRSAPNRDGADLAYVLVFRMAMPRRVYPTAEP